MGRRGKKQTKEEPKNNKRIIVNGIDPSRLWNQITSGAENGLDYIRDSASGVADFVEKNVSYLRDDVNPENIAGGAKAVWENIASGNGQFFKDWATSEDTPFVARATGISAGLGGIVVGTVLGGKALGVTAAAAAKYKIAAASLSTFSLTAGVGTLLTRAEFVEKTFNFAETAVEVDLNQTTDKFFAEAVKKLQTLLKNLAGSLAGLGGRTLARVVVDQAGKQYLEINRRTLGILSLTMSEEIMEDIRSSLANIASSLFNLGKDIASKAVVLLSRDYLADLGVPGVTKGNDKEEFTLSDRFEAQAKKAAGTLNIPDWMQEALVEGYSEFYEALKEQLVNRGGVIDAARREQIVFT